MSHDVDCPARYGCCPNDEYGCPIHIEPPCNCDESPSVTDDAGTYGAVTGGNGRYVLPCGCVPPCEGHHEDES